MRFSGRVTYCDEPAPLFRFQTLSEFFRVYDFWNCCATATIAIPVGMRALLQHDNEAVARETREGDIRSRSSAGLISLMDVFIFRLYNSYTTYYYHRVDGRNKWTHGRRVFLFRPYVVFLSLEPRRQRSCSALTAAPQHNGRRVQIEQEKFKTLFLGIIFTHSPCRRIYVDRLAALSAGRPTNNARGRR